jgi:hypothetical protein
MSFVKGGLGQVARRHRTIIALVLITLAGGALRACGLSRGAPFHFHADEMLALRGAAMLHAEPDAAAQSAKFFVYPVLPKRMLGVLMVLHEELRHPFDLALPEDAETLMMLGRCVSLACSILIIPIAFLIGRRVAGTRAGLLSAALVAGTVAQVTNAHFFTTDMPLALFCALALWALVYVAQEGRVRAYLCLGLALGAAMSCKYTAAFLLLPLANVHIVSPSRPRPRPGSRDGNLQGGGARAWATWFALGCAPIVIAVAVFLVLNPLVLEYPDKFRADVLNHIVTPNFTNAADAPIWTAQFADETVRAYWFTNLLPWNLGPALALWGLAGVVWLLVRRWIPIRLASESASFVTDSGIDSNPPAAAEHGPDAGEDASDASDEPVRRHDRAGLAVASYSIFYYLVSSQTTTPYMRYALPLGLSFAIAAAALSADLLERNLLPRSLLRRNTRWPSRWPLLGMRIWTATTATVVALTWLWGLAYMGVYRDVDPRLEAAAFVKRRISPGARILVEPSHNTPPMGSYHEAPQFFTEYVGFGRDTIRQDGYMLHTLDVYQYLYDASVPPAQKRAYINARLAEVDYVVMDDTFDEFYEHLHGPEHAPVREYYRDLFSGALGFHLMREFHASPTLFGFEIPDDAAEMTFSLFDHPDVYVFQRDVPAN